MGELYPIFTQNFEISVGIERENYLQTIKEIQLARGGARPNAGRELGTMIRFNRGLLERTNEGGQSPLDYMLEMIRDQFLDTRLRIDAAKGRCPCVHQKPSAISVDLTTPDVTHEECLKSLA